jgi:DNA-binding NtrC family response regulator
MEKQKQSILIIDDDKSILNIFVRILQKQGYNTDTAETGKEAMEKLQDQRYDLALIDIKLPDTNGTDLLAKMHTEQPDTILIAVTGFPSLEDATKAIDRGAAAYLVKPVKSEELVRIIAEKLNKQEEAESPL